MRSAIVLVASTRAARGEYPDFSGPIAEEFLRGQGLAVTRKVVADAHLADALSHAFATSPAVILVCGGTGITSDDRSVEALTPHLKRELPGIAHAFYAASANVPTAALSRTVAGVTDRTFAMATPGSTGAVKDACAVLEPLLGHLLDQLEDNHEH